MQPRILGGNIDNRPLRPSHVQDLAHAMRSGQWRATHESILVDVNGVVADGQHRLHAIVESGCQALVLLGACGAVTPTR